MNQAYYAQPEQYAQPGQYASPTPYAQPPSVPKIQQHPEIQQHLEAPPPIAPPTKYPHLEALPMYPLESAEGERKRQEKLRHSEKMLSMVQEIPKPTVTQRAGLILLEASGATIINNRKIENNAYKVNAYTSKMIASDIHTLVLTRWTLAPECPGEPLLVDIIEQRSPVGITYYAKGTREAKFLFRGKHKGTVKRGSTFKKRFNMTPVDNVSIINADKSETPLDMVLRLERPIAPVVAPDIMKGFDKRWNVPSPA